MKIPVKVSWSSVAVFVLTCWVSLTQIKPVGASLMVIFIVFLGLAIQTVFNSVVGYREDLKTQIAQILVRQGLTQGDALNRAHQFVISYGTTEAINFIEGEKRKWIN